MQTKHTKYYDEDGNEIPSVTTILKVLNKPSLIAWAHKQGIKGISLDKATSYAIEVGNMLHHRINCYAIQEPAEFNDFCSKRAIAKSAKLFNSFLYYVASRKAKIIESEKKLTAERYGGTLDLVVQVDGSQEIWDIKTSSDIWPEHIIQVCAYAILWHEHRKALARPRVVLIPRAGKLYAPDINENAEMICKRIWNLIVPLWYARKELDEIIT